jgi:hypothetical protein
MDRRFTALRVIATIFKILAWLSLIAGVLAAIGALAAGFLATNQTAIPGLNVGGPLAGIAAFIAVLIMAILYFLLFYAGGDFIYVFLSIEENTRRMAYLFQQQYMSRQPPYNAPTTTQNYSQ